MNGIIVKAIGGIYYVEASDGIYECKARGVFRRKNISPVGGDRVEFSLEDDGSGVIEKIEERRSLLIRPPLANLDMLVFVSSTCEPRPNLLLLDKFIAIAVFKKIEPVVVFTKIDKESCDELVDIYKGAGIKTFQVDNTTGEGSEAVKAVLEGKAKHQPYQKQPPKEQPFHLLVDIQAKLSEGKGEGYARWAKHYNLKEMSKTLIFLQENKIGSIEEMQERVNAATARYHELGDSIKAAEQRMAEIAVLRAHIVNYARTRPVYDAYRKAGYSKKFLEEHREQITLHKAAKAAFDEANLKKLPKVKELDAEYAALLSQKKAAYPAYRKARDKMQELKKAQKNVELFFTEEKDTKEKLQTR